MTSTFRSLGMPLPGLHVLERAGSADARGRFRRIFCADELKAFGWDAGVAQVNHSLTLSAGTARGIHFQRPPHSEDKLVSCVEGAIWDVAVDLRVGSSTFKRWHGEVLSADNGRAMLVPKGCGHGFVALTDNACVVYVHSAAYSPHAEDGVHPLDPAFGIAWPVPLRELAAKDAARPFIDGAFRGIAP